MRILLVLTLYPIILFSQEIPTIPRNYFNASPIDRIIQLDTAIRVNKNSVRAEFIANDLASLTGDTTNIRHLYTCTGHLADQIVSRNDGALKKVFRRWKKTFRKNKISKLTAVLDSVDYYAAFWPEDTLTIFLFYYVKLPVLSRIDYFESHYQQTSLAQKMELELIVADLNSVTGCDCSPYRKTDGIVEMHALEVANCIAAWRVAVARKK